MESFLHHNPVKECKIFYFPIFVFSLRRISTFYVKVNKAKDLFSYKVSLIPLQCSAIPLRHNCKKIKVFSRFEVHLGAKSNSPIKSSEFVHISACDSHFLSGGNT